MVYVSKATRFWPVAYVVYNTTVYVFLWLNLALISKFVIFI